MHLSLIDRHGHTVAEMAFHAGSDWHGQDPRKVAMNHLANGGEADFARIRKSDK